MGLEETYRLAQEQYAAYGVDTERALERLQGYAISVHCWQADDVGGFEPGGGALGGGGILATGNYPGKARTVAEARADYAKVLSLCPGSYNLNLHASYGEFPRPVERDVIAPEHFEGWIDWAREYGVGLDFNCTCFSHPKAASGFTLSSKDESIRAFWIEHVRRCREISAAIGEALGTPCVHNVWIPDGAKDVTVDRAGYRRLLAQSLDACFERSFDPEAMKDSVESKLFGIGSEWFTVGSHEFYLAYALSRGKIFCMDMGHYHPTESVADKVSAVLPFTNELMLHVSRPIRWDSDHVVILDDPLRDLAFEIVRCGKGKTIYLALDFFDASINRVGAYVVGIRATLQALLLALLSPEAALLEAETQGDHLKRMALLETAKTLPFGAVWDYYCETMDAPPAMAWLDDVRNYETRVLAKRS